MSAVSKKTSGWEERFFVVRIGSMPVGTPLAFDMYLLVGDRPVLFRKRGDILQKDRLLSLAKHGAKGVLVPVDQRPVYMGSLKNTIADPDTDYRQRGRIIKETAFIHVDDLFTKEDIKPVIHDSKKLVEEMVSFVTEDVGAAVSLMRLSVHDYYTYNHCVDVAVYSIALAKKLYGDDKKILLLAGLGGLLHDIGKRRIDKSIINKTTPLTDEEWQEIKRHPGYGYEYLRGVKAIPRQAKDVVYEHHENFDGTGYPQGLGGDDIGKLTRIVSIADVFDALTTDRSYHKAVTPNEALDTMFSMQPGKFDPNLFRSFNKNFDKKAKIKLPETFDPCNARLMVAPTDDDLE